MIMDKNQAVIQFNDYKINSIKYIYNPEFQFSEALNVRCNFNIELAMNDEGTKGKLTIIIVVFEDAVENNYPFSLEISITGFFTSIDLSREEFYNLLKVNGVAVLFPFLRSTVADITKSANVETLILPLFNFVKMMEDQQDND